MIRNRDNVRPYVTKDRSTIRELYHPNNSHVQGFSLAEAEVGAGTWTEAHAHEKSQEIYYILEGAGTMRLGGRLLAVKPGDAVLVPPGVPHNIKAERGSGIRILCACCPPYSHEDTRLTGSGEETF
jgi:mannose-6-phosphate isomerase-like protein (cupin superfamily)